MGLMEVMSVEEDPMILQLLPLPQQLQQQQHHVENLVPVLLFQQHSLQQQMIKDLNLTTLQNMTMEKQLTYLFNSMQHKGQANFHLTTEYHGEETLLLMMQYLEDIMMLEILSNLDFQWQLQSQSLHGVVSTSREVWRQLA